MFSQLTGRLAMGGLAAGSAALAAFGALSHTLRESAFIGIYLNDHLLGSGFGAELAARIAAAHRHEPEGPALEALADEIREDRDTLIELMKVLDVPVRHYKVVLGWAAEKAGRLKPNGHLLERSPLSDLEEFEMMRLGVEGKGACWRTLRTLADHATRLEAARLDALIVRARRQADTLEEFRVRTADRLIS